MNNPVVLADFHNLSLFHSLQLLFEKRLGGKLFRPIGIEWFDNGYFKLAEPYGNDPATVAQFLEVNSIPKDGTQPLNDTTEAHSGIYEFTDLSNQTTNKGITFEAFKNMKFDIIIASIPDHIKPFQELIQKYQPQAKFIFQMGNIYWDKTVNFNNVPNVMASVAKFNLPASCNSVFYHQEAEDEIFRPQNKKHNKEIVSFVNCLPSHSTIGNYIQLKSLLPEYNFKSYGISCDNGIVTGTQNISNIMNESYFGIHLKFGGDGYGAIIHNWLACGKPVIVNYETYKNQLAGQILIPDETCISCDSDSDIPQVIDKIRNISPWKYEWMCQKAREIFKEKVNYDREETEIRKFLERLN
jgi:hypothetical protein